ncbi:MAG: hypothetical protein WD749_06300 [Phycisphaerales bacterium]
MFGSLGMLDTFFGDGAAWYTVPALIGTAFFVLRMVLLSIGADHHFGDLHGDLASAGGHAGDAADSTHSFQVLSVQSVASFVMGFGWAGLAALRSDWSLTVVNLVAVAAGVGMVWLLALLLRGLHQLQSSGNIHLGNTVGRTGEVYVTVPGTGRGKGQVRLAVQNRLRIFDAITTGEDLSTGTRVTVVAANDDNTLSVARA